MYEEPDLIFSRDQHSKYFEDLFKYGPYSGAQSQTTIPVLDIDNGLKDLKSAYSQLKDKVNYYLSKICGAKLGDPQQINIASLNDKVRNSSDQLTLVVAESGTIENLWMKTKLTAMVSKKRVQFFRTGRVRSLDKDKGQLPYVAQGLAAQLVAKLGATPWLVGNDPSEPFVEKNTLIVGVAFYRSVSDKLLRYGVAQFYDVSNLDHYFALTSFNLEVKGLYLPQGKTKELLTKGMQWYKDRQGKPPDWLFLYKSTRLHREEKRDLAEFKELKWVHVYTKNDGTIRLYDLDDADPIRPYMVRRGLAYICTRLGPVSEGNGEPVPELGKILLTTTGVIKWKYGERRTLGTPKPLELAIHSNFKVDLEMIPRQVLALTRMDWENMNPEYREPYLFKYARRIAENAEKLPKMGVDPAELNFGIRDVM
jgi:argonaute-like protein implicated in RNA metabolism and viral defense